MTIYRWHVVLVAFLAVCVGVSGSQAQEPKKGGGRGQAAPGKEAPHPPKVGDMAPDIELKNEKGDLVSGKDRKVAYLMTSTSHGGRAPVAVVLDELAKLK